MVKVKPEVFQHIGFTPMESAERVYPFSLMGVIAAVRQAFFDARYYALDQADYHRTRRHARVPSSIRPRGAGSRG